MREGNPSTISEPWLNLTTALIAVVTVAVSLYPGPLFTWASQAVLKLF